MIIFRTGKGEGETTLSGTGDGRVNTILLKGN